MSQTTLTSRFFQRCPWAVLGLALLLLGTGAGTTVRASDITDGPLDGCNNNNLCCKVCDPLTGKCRIVKCEKKGPQVGETITCPTGKSVIAFNLRYRHSAYDYVTQTADAAASGCTPCGQAGPQADTNAAQQVNLLRAHFPDTDLIGSFGPVWGCNWDIWLRCFQPGTSANGRPTGVPGWQILIQQPSKQPIDFLVGVDGDGDGVFADQKASFFRSLRFFAVDGTAVATPDLASHAILTAHEGETFRFEMFSENGDGLGLLGRFTRFEDRNGRAITSSWKYATSDASLTGTLRTKLRIRDRITDSYGRSLAFTYNETTQVMGQWVVTDIALPTGGHLGYSYSTLPSAFYGTRETLTGVSHPDGSASTFSAVIDPALSCVKWSCDDPAAEPTSRRKTVWLTTAPWKDPANPANQRGQIFNRVRQIADGEGKVSFQATIKHVDTPSGREVRTLMLNEGRLMGIVHDNGDALTASYEGTIGGAGGADTHPSLTSPTWEGWVKTKSWTPGPNRNEPATAISGEGDTTHYARTATDQATSVVHPDGSTETWTYNAFTEPLVVIDRLGRRTESTYDAAGNRLSLTKAAGTGDAGTWTWTYWTAADSDAERGQPGQLKTSADANGNVTEYAYFPSGDLKRVVEPADVAGDPRAAWQFTYDAAGRLLSKTDPTGRVVSHAWDSRSRLVDIGYADGSHETFTYATSGADVALLTQRSDRNGNRTDIAYDLAGRVILTTEAVGQPETVSTAMTYLDGNRGLPASETRHGETTTFTYDSRLRRTAIARQVRVGTVLTSRLAYDNADRLVEQTDPYGRRTFQVYDVNSRVVRTVRECVPGGVPAGATPASLPRILSANPPYHIDDLEFDAEGQLLARRDGRGIRSTFAYDGQGRLIEQVEAESLAGVLLLSPEAARTRHAYDAQGNRLVTTLPRSFVRQPDGAWIAGSEGVFLTTWAYTGRNLSRLMTEAAGAAAGGARSLGRRETLTTYTPTGKVASVRNARGFTTSYRYGLCCDRLVEITDPAGALTGFGYDFHGNRLSMTDGNGNATTTAFDARHRPRQQTNAAGETTLIAYDDRLGDGAGLDAVLAVHLTGLGIGAGSDFSATRVTNANGESSAQIHDGAGRVVRVIDANGNASTTSHDALVTVAGGAVLVETARSDALGHAQRSRADGCGFAREMVDAEGHIARASHDANGNRIATRDANGIGEDCGFDARDRDLVCTDTAGASTSRVYDSHSNVVSTSDARGKVTTARFDALDRRERTTDRILAITAFTYDAMSNLISITDAEGGVTDYGYDSRDLLVSEIFPTGQNARRTRRAYAYDLGRRLTLRQVTTLPSSTFTESTTYFYDLANRLTERRYPDSKHDTFTYDLASRLTRARSLRYRNRVERSYDPAGRLTQERLVGEGSTALPGLWDVFYGYDAANRLLAVTYPDGGVTTRTFTDRNQLSGVAFSGAAVASRLYDAGGRLTSATLGNGLVEARTYRAGDNLTASIATPGVTNFTYTHDANKRKTREVDLAVPAASQTFAYDDADRLTSWSSDAGVTPAQTQTWSLTAVGDWTTTVRTGVTETRTHAPVHEIKTVKVGAAAAKTLAHDAKGNLTKDETAQTYSWDVENRLLVANVPAKPGIAAIRADYVYDALGRRVAKTVNGRVTRFLHDGAQVIQEEDGVRVAPLAENASDGSTANATQDPANGGVLQPASGLASVTRIDFTIESAPIAPGFLGDKGRVYGARTNGQTYGWTVATSSSDRVKRFAAVYEEADTFIRAHRPGASTKSWSIAVPNGTYPVVVVSGDATSRSHTNHLIIEGIAVTDPDPSAGAGYERGDFDGYAVMAVVTDGALTIAPGIGHVDPTLCFLEIGPAVPAGTPMDPEAVTRLNDLVELMTDKTYGAQGPILAKRRYVYASYVDEPVMMVSGASTKHYFHQNHLYSVAAMTSSTGAVVERYRYDAYGKRTVTNAAGTPIAASTIGQQRGFTGYYLDAETGLYYARARMYSAGLGRFVSRDPLGYIDGKSLYRAYFSPNFLDPTGQAECPPPFALNTSCSKWECWLYLHSVEPGFELAQVFSGGYSIDVVTGVATPMTYTVQIPVALHECHYSCPNGTGYVHRFTEPNPPNGGSA